MHAAQTAPLRPAPEPARLEIHRMPHPSRLLSPLSSAASTLSHWPVILAALAFGLLECLALARSRWQDRRQARRGQRPAIAG